MPPGTVCDYDMEKGLICKYPEGSAPAVMSPAAYLDPAAAAAESREIPAEMLQQVLAQQDNGSGYTAAIDGVTSDASAASYTGDQVHAPVPDPAGVKYAMNLQQQQRLTNPGVEDQHFHTRNLGVQDVKLVGNVNNGQVSTWVTDAMTGAAGLSTA